MLSEEKKAVLGKRWAQTLSLRMSAVMPFNYTTDAGIKSPLGIYNMIMDMAKESLALDNGEDNNE